MQKTVFPSLSARGKGGSQGDLSALEGILWRLASWGAVVAIPLICFLLALSLCIEQTS